MTAVYQTIDEVRAAVRAFIERYNAAWERDLMRAAA